MLAKIKTVAAGFSSHAKSGSTGDLGIVKLEQYMFAHVDFRDKRKF